MLPLQPGVPGSGRWNNFKRTTIINQSESYENSHSDFVGLDHLRVDSHGGRGARANRGLVGEF